MFVFSLYNYGLISLRHILETNQTTPNNTLNYKTSHQRNKQDSDTQSFFQEPLIFQILICMIIIAMIGIIVLIICCIYDNCRKKEIKIEKKEEKKEEVKSIEMTSPKKNKECVHIDIADIDYI